MKLILSFLSAFFLASCSLFSSFEEPNMKPLHSDKNIEIRAYDPALLMSVTMDSASDDAMNDGFMMLFDYITGDNADKSKIKMTAPVLREFANNAQTVSFFAPNHFTKDTLPKPNNKMIKISEWAPETSFAVITFSGRWTKENFNEQAHILQNYITKQGYQTLPSQPSYAYYNDPMTPWFMRKNEIWVAVKK